MQMTLPRRVACKSSRDEVGAFTLREHHVGDDNGSCNTSHQYNHAISTISNDHHVSSSTNGVSNRVGKLRRLEMETYANMEEQLIHYLDELYWSTINFFSKEKTMNVNEYTCSNGNRQHVESVTPMQWTEDSVSATTSKSDIHNELEHMKGKIESFHNFISSVYSALIETSFVLRSCWVHMGNVHEAFWPLAHLSCITQHILITLARHTVSRSDTSNVSTINTDHSNVKSNMDDKNTNQSEYLILQKGPQHLPWVGVTLCIVEKLICALRSYVENINNTINTSSDSYNESSSLKQHYNYYSHFTFHDLCHWAHSSSSSSSSSPNASEPIHHPISRLIFLNCNGFGWLDGEEHNDTSGYHESVQCRQAINYALNQLIHNPAYHNIGHAQHFLHPANKTNKHEQSYCRTNIKENSTRPNSMTSNNIHFNELEGCTIILMSNAILLDGGVPSLSIAQNHLLFTTFHQYGRGLACCVVSRETALAMQIKEKKAAKLHHHHHHNQHKHKLREREVCLSISHPTNTSITPELHSSSKSINLNNYNNIYSSNRTNMNIDPGDAVSDAGSLSTTCSSSYVDSNEMDGKLSSLESSLSSSQGTRRPVLLNRSQPSPHSLSLSLSIGHSCSTTTVDKRKSANDTQHSPVHHHLLLQPSRELQHDETVKTNTIVENCHNNNINTLKFSSGRVTQWNSVKRNHNSDSNNYCLGEKGQQEHEKNHELQQEMKQDKDDKWKHEMIEIALGNPLSTYKFPHLEAISCGSKTVNGVAIQAMMPHSHGPLIIHVEIDSLQHLKRSECRTFNTVSSNNNQYNLNPSVRSLFVSHNGQIDQNKNTTATIENHYVERSYRSSIVTHDKNAKKGEEEEEEEEEEEQQQNGVKGKKLFSYSNTFTFTNIPYYSSPSPSSSSLISAPWLKTSNTYEVFTSTSLNALNAKVIEEWKELFEWLVVLLMAPVPTLIVEWTINTNVETSNDINSKNSSNSVHNVISLTPTSNNQNELNFYTSSFAHVQETYKTREVCDLRITSASSVIIQLLRSYGEHLYELIHQQQQSREHDEEEEEEQQQQSPKEHILSNNNTITSDWSERLKFCEQIRYITSQFLPLSHLNSINMSNNCYCTNDNDHQRPRLWSKGGLDVVNESEQEVYENMLLTSVQFRRS